MSRLSAVCCTRATRCSLSSAMRRAVSSSTLAPPLSMVASSRAAASSSLSSPTWYCASWSAERCPLETSACVIATCSRYMRPKHATSLGCSSLAVACLSMRRLRCFSSHPPCQAVQPRRMAWLPMRRIALRASSSTRFCLAASSCAACCASKLPGSGCPASCLSRLRFRLTAASRSASYSCSCFAACFCLSLEAASSSCSCLACSLDSS
mmetsp:Transcript_43516/g.104508  ORF Transcript_43516/g.104508 Transcript_43516/m.104508 type:complete len:209 (-) Transcript_43516:72-698(-)